MILISVATLLLVVYGGCWWWQFRRLLHLAAQVPGPPALPILGNALIFLNEPEEILNKLVSHIKTYGEYVRFWIGPELVVCVKNPADIRLILTSNKVNLKGPMYKYMKVFLGPGVLSEGGPVWRAHRKIAHPSYSKKTVQGYASAFNDNAKELAEALTKKDPNEVFNVYFDVVHCTTQNVCRTIVGLSREESKHIKSMDVIVKETHAIYDFIFTNMTHWWYQFSLIHWLSGRKAKERYYLKLIDEMTSDMLGKRRRTLAEKTLKEEELGVIDRFILSGQLSEEDIKAETMTFFTASQEASAKIGSTALLIMAHHPEWQDKVYAEVTEAFGDKDFIPDDQVRQLPILDMVYKEAVRYMPIAAFIQRTVEYDITINNGKITLPKGASVVIPIHSLHRDPKHWDDPDLVRPERFLPENVKKRDPNVFVPFSLGGMDCIGRSFAESMIKITLVHVVRRVKLSAVGPPIHQLPLNVAISVKFTNGYNLKAEPRHSE